MIIKRKKKTALIPGGYVHQKSTEIKESKTFSGRQKVSKELLKEIKEGKSGVIQSDPSGNGWRIVSVKDGEYWNAHYKTKASAEKGLAAYHANK